VSETRFITTWNGQGEIISQEPYVVSDEELADEATSKDMRDNLLTKLQQPWNTAQVERAVKALIQLLAKRGLF